MSSLLLIRVTHSPMILPSRKSQAGVGSLDHSDTGLCTIRRDANQRSPNFRCNSPDVSFVHSARGLAPRASRDLHIVAWFPHLPLWPHAGCLRTLNFVGGSENASRLCVPAQAVSSIYLVSQASYDIGKTDANTVTRTSCPLHRSSRTSIYSTASVMTRAHKYKCFYHGCFSSAS